MDFQSTRTLFPALARPHIYLDNPAGTQVPLTVAQAIQDAILHKNANLGGAFETSRAAEAIVHEAHQDMAFMLGAAHHDEIIIGPSMTALTFHCARALCANFNPGETIVLSRMDHEGNVSPWLWAAREAQLEVRMVDFDTSTPTWQINPEDLRAALTPSTRLVALTGASNLTGSINDLSTLCTLIKQAGAISFIDAVQYAPHVYTDVQELGCDFLACSAYKFFGPHLGILYASRAIQAQVAPPKVRCAPETPGAKFEMGTPQIELLAGLSATVEHFRTLAQSMPGTPRQQLRAMFDASRRHEEALAERLIQGLGAIDGVTIFGITNPNRMHQRVPTVAFRHATVKPSVIAAHLAEEGIFVWSGHNYALEVVRSLDIPEEEGVVRIGIVHYNTEAEIDRTLQALRACLG